jgi:hypothetical protein
MRRCRWKGATVTARGVSMRNAWRSVRSADGMTAMPAFSHRQEGARRPEVHVTPMPDRHR